MHGAARKRRRAYGATHSVPESTSRPMLLRMDDYSPQAKAYWWATVSLGAAAFILAVAQVAAMDRSAILQVAAGTAVAAIAGMFPVRIPGGKTSVAGAEIFIFLLLLIHGPWAAA